MALTEAHHYSMTKTTGWKVSEEGGGDMLIETPPGVFKTLSPKIEGR